MPGVYGCLQIWLAISSLTLSQYNRLEADMREVKKAAVISAIIIGCLFLSSYYIYADSAVSDSQVQSQIESQGKGTIRLHTAQGIFKNVLLARFVGFIFITCAWSARIFVS